MALHLIAEDPSPCEDCEGSRTLPLYEYDHLGVLRVISRRPCSACCCEVCQEPTETPPLCERHQREQDDRDAAKAYREGRYEELDVDPLASVTGRKAGTVPAGTPFPPINTTEAAR